ncbi:hypothetical protein L0Y34_00230 [Candidatus Parcubacteria bacterium]|nr:hypothetical protein [Candidatus Parcubacteria bacterium]
MRLTLSALENAAMLALMRRPHSLPELHDHLSARHHISRAGFYKVVKGLKKKEIVVQEKNTLSISKIWLAEAQDFFRSLTAQKETPSYLAERIAHLESGERLVYTFRSLKEIDIFLLHLLIDVSERVHEKQILIHEPHEFFILLNEARTYRLLEDMRRRKQSLVLLVESRDAIDSEILKQYLRAPADGYRASNTPSGNVARHITHVVGDVFIELALSKRFLEQLSALYATNKLVSEKFIEQVRKLAEGKEKHTIRIYKAGRKSGLLRKRFKKYFV